MILYGRYRFHRGAYRPFIAGYVLAADGHWVKQSFLIDSGADETFLHSRSVDLLGIDTSALNVMDDVSGVGGPGTPYIRHDTELRFQSPKKEVVVFTGQVNVFLDPHAADFPILGRDVLNHFSVIFDWKRNVVLLIAEPDDYQVVRGQSE
jgi:hypothetical protein